MQPDDLSELLRPKSKNLLSESLDREELVRLNICVCCRKNRAIDQCVHCRPCSMRLGLADIRAFSGYFAELNRLV